MSGQMEAEPKQLEGYAGLLERNANHFKTIDEHAENVASDTAGFTGLMMALIPAVEAVTALYGETLDLAHSKLMGVKDQLKETAADYEAGEKKISEMLKKIDGELDKMKA